MYGGALGGKPWTVQVQSVPRVDSSTVSASTAMHLGQPSCTGNMWFPQLRHRLPSRCGSSDGHVNTPSDTGT